jgi:hypothetical protein
VVDEISRNEISRNNSFRILQNFVSRKIQNFAKFREIFATKFRFLLDKAKNTVAEAEQELAA